MKTTTDRLIGRKPIGRHTVGMGLACFVCGAILVGAAGCGGAGAWRMPWQQQPDRVAGVTPPYERINELRGLSRSATSASPAEQQRISHELAEQFGGEPDPLIRAQIVETLTGYPTKDAAVALREALADSTSEVRTAACVAWGKRGGPEAVTLLSERLASDTNSDVRLAATRALGETHDASAVAGLAVALEDQDPALQYRAVLSLREVTGKDFGNDVNRWRQYAKGEPPAPEQPTSIAQRLRNLF